jgi:hypothetical protein
LNFGIFYLDYSSYFRGLGFWCSYFYTAIKMEERCLMFSKYSLSERWGSFSTHKRTLSYPSINVFDDSVFFKVVFFNLSWKSLIFLYRRLSSLPCLCFSADRKGMAIQPSLISGHARWVDGYKLNLFLSFSMFLELIWYWLGMDFRLSECSTGIRGDFDLFAADCLYPE